MTTDEKIDMLVEKISTIDTLAEKVSTIDLLVTAVNGINLRLDNIDTRIDNMQKVMNARFDSIESDINALRQDIKHISNREVHILDFAMTNNKESA